MINSVEIQGIVGSATVTEIGDSKVVRLSVATDTVYTNKEKEKVVETTWHQIESWNKAVKDAEAIKKGVWVNVKGRLRARRYTDNDGGERVFQQILANEITVLETS